MPRPRPPRSSSRRRRALKKYYDELVKKYAKIDEKLLKKLDYEAKKPGIEAMKKDTRVLATVQGQTPVTVGLLTTALAEQFFHGVDNATQKKRLTKAKGTTLDALISVRVVANEVERVGIPKSPEYQRRLDDSTESLVFGAFVRKVVLPGVKLDEQSSASTTTSTRPTTPSRPSTSWRASASASRRTPRRRWRSSGAAPTSSG